MHSNSSQIQRRLPWAGRGICVAIALVLCGGSGAAITLAQKSPDEPTAEQRTAHAGRMKKVAESIQVTEGADEKSPATAGKERQEAKLREEPVLRYIDDTRRQYDSTLWIWGTSGRPTAVMAIEWYPKYPAEKNWLYEIASLSTKRITVKRGDELNWKATEAGLDLKLIPEGPLPATKPAARLVQMKELGRRFAAHEQATIEGRIELRLLAQPLYRYAGTEEGLLDGALFAFANGTNPEVLLAIEAHQKPGEAGGWRYGLAQMTGEKVVVALDGKTVWERALAEPPASRASYVNGWLRKGKEEP